MEDIEDGHAHPPELSTGYLFNIERVFIEKTLASFAVPFRVILQCQVSNHDQYSKDRQKFDGEDSPVAGAYRDSVLRPLLDEHDCFFHLAWREVIYKESIYDAFPVTIERVTEKDGKIVVSEFLPVDFKEALEKIPFADSGCAISLVDFHTSGLMSPALIEENYKMITDEQRRAILADPRYSGFEEGLAVHALKRRLEYERQQFKQVHESDWVTITTEQAGRGIKIKWQIKQQRGLDLLGYRKSGSFSSDQFDEASNGVLVVQATRSGEVIEFLKEGETYFYTFLWRRSTPRPFTYWGASRFQITLMTEDERKLIADAIRRIQGPEKQETLDPVISRALKELGRYRQFETAMRNAEKEAVADIQKTPLSDSEKREEIEKLRDQVSLIRERYQQ